MKKAKLIVILIILVLVIIVFLQNTEVVETKVLFATISMSRALLLLLTFSLGFITGLIGSFLLRKSTKTKIQNQ
jgi:uncharacterized integral membrane protein